MKKTLSILLVISLMLLSACQLGQMPGKATATGDETVELFQCYHEYSNGMRDYYLTRSKKCDEAGDTFYISVGYVYTQPGTGRQQLIQCQREREEDTRHPVTRKVSHRRYADRLPIIGANCEPNTIYPTTLGYIPTNEIPKSTKKAYRCWYDEWNAGKWDHWVGLDPYKCHSWQMNRDFTPESSFNVLSTATPTTQPAVQITAETTCDQLKATNKDLKDKINAVNAEIASLQAQIQSIGG